MGTVPQPFSFEFSKMPVTQYTGGTAKIADSTVFNVSTQIAVAEVTVEPGAMRELHWHPTEDEWGFFLYAPPLCLWKARATDQTTTGRARRA